MLQRKNPQNNFFHSTDQDNFCRIQSEKKRASGRPGAELLLYEIAVSQFRLNISHTVLHRTAFSFPCHTISAAAVILHISVSLALMPPHCPQFTVLITTLIIALSLFHNPLIQLTTYQQLPCMISFPLSASPLSSTLAT